MSDPDLGIKMASAVQFFGLLMMLVRFQQPPRIFFKWFVVSNIGGVAAVALIGVSDKPLFAAEPQIPTPAQQLQARIDNAERINRYYSRNLKTTGPLNLRQSPAVVLRGDYVLTEPIKIGTNTRLYFDGATLDCRKAPRDMPAIEGSGWRSQIFGSGSIINAGLGIKLDTGNMRQNLNAGQTLIQGITFSNCALPIDVECRSSIVAINGCSFIGGSRIVSSTMCDQLTLTDCVATLYDYDSANPPICMEHGRTVITRGIYTPPPQVRTVVDAGWVLMRGPATAERLLIARDVRFGGESGGMATVIVDTPWVKTRQGIVGAEIALRDLHAPNHPNGNERKLGRPWGPHVICRQLPKSVELGQAWGPQLGPRVVVADGFDVDLSLLENLK